MSARILTTALLASMFASPLAAQAAPPAPTPDTGWHPFLGCWSSSSRGEIGPMVCVVPTTSSEQVEFVTVDGDSVVARSIVDASGTRRAQVRGACVGSEAAAWSPDRRRLYMHAEYRCATGERHRGDAILAMTHSDAFSQVEGTITTTKTSTRTVNFISQLDSTAYPAEVRQRLAGLQLPMQQPVADDAPRVVTTHDVIDAATQLDADVVQAWLEDRGARSVLTVAEMRSLHAPTAAAVDREPLRVPSARARDFLAAGYQVLPDSRTSSGSYRGQAIPPNVLITPAMVNFGGSASGFPQLDRGVAFRWP